MFVLTRAQFQEACEALIDKHEKHTPNAYLSRSVEGWQWHSVHGLGYMVRLGWTSRINSTSVTTCVPEDLQPDELEDYDVSTLPLQTLPCEVLAVQQYVVYSPTFQVPAFYFTIQDSNGSFLPLGEIIGTALFQIHSFPQTTSIAPHGISISGSNFPLLSQGEHPVLGTPCWYFHPCETSAAVTELLRAAGVEEEQTMNNTLSRWMEAWFLVLSSVVDLR